MAKFDVDLAYCGVAIHAEDCHLLGMKYKGSYYVHKVLPFGLRSGPFIFVYCGHGRVVTDTQP